MLVYPLFGHELLALLAVEIVPGDVDLIAVPGKNTFNLVQRVDEGPVIHVEHLDLGRLCSRVSAQAKAKAKPEPVKRQEQFFS